MEPVIWLIKFDGRRFLYIKIEKQNVCMQFVVSICINERQEIYLNRKQSSVIITECLKNVLIIFSNFDQNY